MATTKLTLTVKMPWWWRAAFYGFVAWNIARTYLGFSVDAETEGNRFGAFITRHTRIAAE